MAATKNVLLEKVEALTVPTIQAQGAELVDLQFVHEQGRWVLRYFLDTPNGITLDECAVLSNHLGEALDAADIIPQSYSLEVSSPGINRPLRKIEDFQKFIGERVDINTYAPLNGRKHFRGILKSVGPADVTVLDYEEKSCTLSLTDIAKAKLDPEIAI